MNGLKAAAFITAGLALSGCEGSQGQVATYSSQDVYGAPGYYGAPTYVSPGYVYSAQPSYVVPYGYQPGYAAPYAYGPSWRERENWHEH